MRCPFLREEQVRSCQASPFRKQIARRAAHGDEELCSSPDYRTCSVAPAHHETQPERSRCPFLVESLVQFCSAIPLARYVPWSEASLTMCGHDGHRFCDTFLEVAGLARREQGAVPDVDGMAVPGWLFFSPNHMWMDVGDDGLCHVGLDALLARVLGVVEHLVFATPKGTVRPKVVVTAGGVDLALTYPLAMPIVSINARLRSSLDRLTSDPYGSGWLFEGRMDSPPEKMALVSGESAREWMTREASRLTTFVHDDVLARKAAAADGGVPVSGLVQHLDRDEIHRLFSAFFEAPSPEARRS